MLIYRVLPVHHVIYPDFNLDDPQSIINNINRLSPSARRTIDVEYANGTDATEGYSITAGDNEPVVITEGGFAVDPFSERVVVVADNLPDYNEFVTLGQDQNSNSDKH